MSHERHDLVILSLFEKNEHLDTCLFRCDIVPRVGEIILITEQLNNGSYEVRQITHHHLNREDRMEILLTANKMANG